MAIDLTFRIPRLPRFHFGYRHHQNACGKWYYRKHRKKAREA